MVLSNQFAKLQKGRMIPFRTELPFKYSGQPLVYIKRRNFTRISFAARSCLIMQIIFLFSHTLLSAGPKASQIKCSLTG
jgi:hypothetical protein